MTVNHSSSLSLELEQLLRDTGKKETIEQGTFLFSEGEMADKLYLLQSGLIRIGKVSRDGNEISLRISDIGDLIGEISLYASDDLTYILNAKVLEAGEVIVVEKATLEKRLLKKSHLTVELMQIMNKHIRRDQMRLYDLIANGKKGALYSTLIRLSNSYGKKQKNGILIDILLTDQELANFCGTARESVNRLLRELRKQQVISVEKGYITIHELAHLKTEINCEDCPVVLCTIH